MPTEGSPDNILHYTDDSFKKATVILEKFVQFVTHLGLSQGKVSVNLEETVLATYVELPLREIVRKSVPNKLHRGFGNLFTNRIRNIREGDHSNLDDVTPSYTRPVSGGKCRTDVEKPIVLRACGGSLGGA